MKMFESYIGQQRHDWETLVAEILIIVSFTSVVGFIIWSAFQIFSSPSLQ